MASNYCLNIWQENDPRSRRLWSSIPYHVFNICFKFHYISPLNLETTSQIHSVVYPRDVLLSQQYGQNIVLSMLANTGLPLEFVQTVLVPDILSFAWKTDADPENLGCKIIKLLVELLVEETDDEGDDQVFDDSLSTLNFNPASQSSIQGLKRVKLGDDDEDHLLPFKKRRRFEDLTSKKECSICLDEFSDGEKVALMPCGHVYHDGCLVRWLETSHWCPLCRYEMPSRLDF